MSIMEQFEAAKKAAVNIIRNEGIKHFPGDSGCTKVDRIHKWLESKVPGFNPDWYEKTAREILLEASSK